MGFFSWNCSCCGISIANKHAKADKKFSRAVLILPNRIIEESSYDGYGNFGCESVYELMGNGDHELGVDLDCGTQEELDELNITAKKPFDIKIVHAHCYQESMCYNDIKPSENCPNQGFFFGENSNNLI